MVNTLKKRIISILQLAVFALFFLLSTACSVFPSAEDRKIKVMVEGGEHFSVHGENLQEVRYGEDATFNISVEEGYYYNGNNLGDGAKYENGKLTVSNVHTPKTVLLNVLAKIFTVKVNGTTGVRLEADHEEVSALTKTVQYGKDSTFAVEMLTDYEYAGASVLGDDGKNTTVKYSTESGVLTVESVKQNVEVYLQTRFTGSIEQSSYMVTLASGAGYAIKGSETQEVPAGDDAIFEIAVAEGYYYVSNNCGAEYDKTTNTITLKNVHAEQEIALMFRRENAVRETYAGGAVEIVTNALGVTYSAIADIGYTFCGFTNEKNDNKPYAYVNELTITEAQAETVKLVPRFEPTAKTKLVEYHANGGKLVSSQSIGDVINYAFESEKLLYPTSFGEWCFKSFEREGYVPVEYNTKADGSGTAYSLGSKILNDDKKITLYVIWEKENPATDFTYEVIENREVALTKYVGGGKKVVIPTNIGGMPVTKIENGCFDGAQIESVVLTKNLVTVEKGAFNNCKQLTSVTLSDTVRYIYDDSFTGCEKLTSLRMIAAMPPVHSENLVNTIVRRFEWLYNTREDYRANVITYGGSSIFQGIDGETVADMLGRSGTKFINGGQNAYVSGPFMMQLYSKFMKDRDVMVFVPELGSEIYSNKLELPIWIALEGFYDAFRYVDISEFKRVFDSFCDFQNGSKSYTFVSKIKLISEGNQTSYEDYLDVMDDYFTRASQFPVDKVSVMRQAYPPEFDSFKDSVVNVINNMYHKYYEPRDMKLYFAAYGMWEDAFPVEKSAYVEYEGWLKENLHFPYISNWLDHLFAYEDLSDSISHLTREAAYRHSLILGNEIKARLHYDGY